ncbi:hypothetical protein BDQ94DRAFT_176583 [Aspergillus welwitschiae]|uniref:Uncharacterized protein n=1 Tax=Aspergillus welwitschiae TaxID=1341132 RepID=A0A3F3PGW8_9EURO|nr:hypothetical protein BDQ94DRAFT_176583 [Aspergillus welwitschiae]RDH26174.1 hypothetical protein BDQ94DRAFT_176583 [Aspergillus welwitschiae]
MKSVRTGDRFLGRLPNMECAVSAHGDMDWSPESFDCLQIPSDDKTLLLSLAKTRPGLIPTVPFDDVIDGKGQVLTILRNGPPGVKKTFTVEATSEYFNLPLYSANLLSTTAIRLRLSNILTQFQDRQTF